MRHGQAQSTASMDNMVNFKRIWQKNGIPRKTTKQGIYSGEENIQNQEFMDKSHEQQREGREQFRLELNKAENAISFWTWRTVSHERRK
jgi:hypothetical protein